MAISWGNQISNRRGNVAQLGWEIIQYPGTVTAGTTSVALTLRLYLWTKYSVSDSHNSLRVTGNWSASRSVPISHGGSGGQTRVFSEIIYVTPSHGGNISVSFSASFSGLEAFGVNAATRVSGTHWVGRRPLVPPARPYGMSAKYESDYRFLVKWGQKDPTSASAPYQSQVISRWDHVTNSWRTIATLSGSATSYLDTSTEPGRRYQYSIQARNTGGGSEWAYAPRVSTTPPAPAAPTVSKAGQDIQVTWPAVTDTVLISELEIWHRVGDKWDAAPLATVPVATTSWTHERPDAAGLHSYALVAVAGHDYTKLKSEKSAPSQAIMLLAPPAAPTRLAPAATAIDVADGARLSWQHNPVDATNQRAYELRWRQVGASAWQTVRGAGNQFHTFGPGVMQNARSYEWQVRTKGDHANYSPWSQVAVFRTSAAPSVTVTMPGAKVDSHRTDVRWTYHDPEGTPQSSWRVTLKTPDGVELYSRAGSGAVRALALPYALENGERYSIEVAARDSDGVWSAPAIVDFVVEFAPPVAADIRAMWDVDSGATIIEVDHPKPGAGEVAAISCEVWRSADGENWHLVAGKLPPSTTVTDPIPPLRRDVLYRVVSTSALPSMRVGEAVTVDTEAYGWIYVNGGPGFSVMAKVRDMGTAGYAVEREKALHRFAGRALPVETMGAARTVTVSLNARLGGGSSAREEWEAMTDLPAPLCYRDAHRREFVSMSDLDTNAQRDRQSISAKLQVIDYAE